MPLDVPGRPDPGRPDYTRRGLFALAGALATAGATDLAWHALHGSPAGSPQRLITASDPGAGAGVVARPGSSGSATPHPTTLAGSSTPTPHASVPASPPAHPANGRGRHHGTGDQPGHGRPAHRRVEQVTLPPPTVAVHSSPAYDVHDLLPDAPHRAIALTVDDGPDPDWTPKVLRLLDKHGVHATFCVVGIHVAAYPGLVRDIHRAGHAIVNHTWSHPLPFASLPEKRIVAEITRTSRAIEKAAGVTPQLFRAPGGEWSPFVYRAIAAYGLVPLDWDVDPADWALPGTRKIIRRMKRAHRDDIVLCHDGGGNRHETVRALRTVIPSWKRRKLEMVPLLLPSQRKPAPPPSSPPPTPTPATSPTATATTTP
jgi:peptidoglycan/xylan/chitin deacetylase (PgdA/CDA1 family)